MKKRNGILTSLILLIGIGYIALLQGAQSFAEGDIESIKWSKASSYVVISDIEREGLKGLLFIRLKDGKEQFVDGDWTVNFSDYGNAIIFGEFPESSPKYDGQQLFYFSGDGQIYSTKLNEGFGEVVSIQENRANNYLMIEHIEGENNIICMIPRLNEGERTCASMGFQKGFGVGMWNPSKDREGVFYNKDSKQVFTYDPWERKPTALNQEEEPEKYNELLSLLTKESGEVNVHSNPGRQEHHIFNKMLNFITVRHSDGFYLYKTSSASEVAWIIDGDHLLIKEPDQLSILEIGTNKLTPLIKEDLQDKTVYFRTYGADQAL